MKISRAGADANTHFSKETLDRRLGYIIEASPAIYVTFEIFDRYKARLKPVVKAHLDALLETFRVHNGFVYAFYDEAGFLLQSFEPVKRFKVALNALRVTQWRVSLEKAQRVATWITSAEDIVVPVFKHKGQWVALDGHTRLKIAHKKGFLTVYGYGEPGAGLSRAFLTAAQRQGVDTIADVITVEPDVYAKEWVQYCDTFIQTFQAKGAYRVEALASRQARAEHVDIHTNETILQQVIQVLAANKFDKVGVFYPLEGEVDVRVLESMYQVYYPVIEAGVLVFAPATPSFIEAAFKTRVPDTRRRLHAPLDAIIVPGLMFDRRGYRLGYGQGYYDAYLKDAPGLKIGVVFAAYLQDVLPVAEHDVLVDVIVTEREVIEINQKTAGSHHV